MIGWLNDIIGIAQSTLLLKEISEFGRFYLIFSPRGSYPRAPSARCSIPNIHLILLDVVEVLVDIKLGHYDAPSAAVQASRDDGTETVDVEEWQEYHVGVIFCQVTCRTG